MRWWVCAVLLLSTSCTTTEDDPLCVPTSEENAIDKGLAERFSSIEPTQAKTLGDVLRKVDEWATREGRRKVLSMSVQCGDDGMALRPREAGYEIVRGRPIEVGCRPGEPIVGEIVASIADAIPEGRYCLAGVEIGRSSVSFRTDDNGNFVMSSVVVESQWPQDGPR